MKSHVLYRFYNSLGHLLYVGITNDPSVRFRNHATNGRPWWDRAVMITLEHFSNRDDLESAERRAIRTERPVYNITHNVSPGDPYYPYPQPDGECPCCGRDVVYNRSVDLTFHIDGSDNLPCWVEIRRGAVKYVGRTDR